ncbi:hypothetical protein FO519_007910 [Halicephalobus sp. NKZ332]|nr:hypothetical protein FO519_007910 [Halicephalobus sp. NKZ332]
MSVSRITEWVLVAGRWTRMSQMLNFRPSDVSQSESIPESEVVFVMIPGNPGNERFYEDFGQRILESLNGKRKTEFLTVSHLNHVELPERLQRSSELERNERFLLQDQVKHKLNFFLEHVPKKPKLILIGHSIGAYMALKILPELISEGFNVVRTLALFPTIEQMAVSPNGTRLGGILRFFDEHDTLSRIILSWLWLLPLQVKRFLVGFNLRDPSIPECIVESAMELISAPVVRNIIHMSNDELKNVVDHDPELFKHKDKILMYYGKTDGWVPNSCALKQLDRLGENHVLIDEDNCEHAFVIKDGEAMTRNVVSLIEKCL